MLTREAFGILFATGLTRDEPVFRRELARHLQVALVRVDREPVRVDTALDPRGDARPRLRGELIGGVRRHSSVAIRAGAHDPVHEPSRHRRLANPVARCNRHTCGRYSIDAVESIFATPAAELI